MNYKHVFSAPEGDGSVAGGAGATDTAAAAAAATAAASASAAAAAGGTFDWKAAGVPDAGLATVAAKGWKAPGDLLDSYVNLEKLVGAPPEQIIKLPKDRNAATMGPVYDQLGRPKTAAEYKLPVPEGAKPEYATTMSAAMHELGLSLHQAQALATKQNEFIAAQSKASLEAYTAEVGKQANALKTEWGGKHDENVAVAKKAAAAFGMTVEHINALEKAMGFAGVHKFLYTIGAKLGEADFVQSGGNAQEFSGLSVDSAKAKVAELKKDGAFIARYNHTDPMIRGEARKEMERYLKVANPGATAA